MPTSIDGLEELLTEEALALLQGEGLQFTLETADGVKQLVFRAEPPETESAAPQAGEEEELRTLAVHADFDDIRLDDLSALVQLVPGANFDIVPPQIPLGGAVALHALKLVIEWKPFRLSSLVIEVQTAQRWELIEGTFAVERLLLSLVAAYPLEPPLQIFCDVRSTLDIGDGLQLDIGLALPDLDVSVELPDDQESAPLAPLLGKVLPDAMLEDFTLTRLHAEMRPREQSYAFGLAVEQSWEVIPGVVTLTGLGIELARSGVDRPTGTVHGSFELAGVPLAVSASRSGGGTAASPTLPVWVFEGGTTKEVPIGALIADLTGKLGVPVPGFIENLVLTSLTAKLDQSTQHFSVRSEWEGTGFVAIDSRPSLQPPLGQPVPPNRTLIASFSNPKGESVSIHDMVAGVSEDLANIVPEGLTVTLNRALYASWQPPATVSRTLFGVDVGAGLDLSQLPLVGQNFPADLGVKLAYTIMIASAALTQPELAALIPLFKTQGVTLGTELLPQGLTLRGELAIGDFKLPLNVPVKVGNDGQIIQDPGTRSGMEPQWFPLEMTLGPVSLERVGVKFDAEELWVLLDAALSVGPLSLGLSGLSVSAPVTMSAPPTFRLDGLALDYRTGSLEIGGSLLRRKMTENGTEVETYDGLAVLKAKLGGKALALSAIAGYAQFQGEPSLFLYAVLGMPIGGPPFFFVEGLSAGFGVNRALTVPTIDKVKDFPLVKQAMGSVPDIGNPDSRAEILQEQVAALSTYIKPELGAGFLAVGVKFTSFKIVSGFALLTMSLGERFELHLLGLARLTVPFSAVDTGIDPIAQIEMALKASFIPEEGFIGVIAQLTSDSFLLSRDCKLTGGFAFYTWLAGRHAGDFVITMGGYHPRFPVPEHYPRVPRLGYNWRIGDTVVIKGESYFALCAHAVMAGGLLQVSFESGDAHASFRASADFLIGWKPYHYDIELRVGISAGYGFLGDVDVSAGLRLWGPEFGGFAEIDVTLFSFTIEFGDQSSRYPKAIDWPDFHGGFLPPDEEICSIAVMGGLLRQHKDGDEEIWAVNPKDLALATDAFVPTKKAVGGRSKVALMEGSGGTFGVRPMAVAPAEVETEHWVTITKLKLTEEDQEDDVTAWFEFSPVRRKVPSAVWGEAKPVPGHPDRILPPGEDDARFVEGDVVTGFEITIKAQPAPGDTDDIRSENLQYDTTPLGDVFAWAQITPFQPVDEDNDDARRERLRTTVSQNEGRGPLLEALGFDPAREVLIDAESLAQAFVVAPQVQQ